MALLEIDSVRFSYGQNLILSDIYLNVKKGEVVGFLGRNGCGKSTLLKIIFGSLKGENQSIRIDGKYYPELFTSKRVKYLTQDMLFPGHLTVLKAIQLFDSDLEYLKTKMEIEQNLTTRLKSLSSGTRKYIETLIFLYSDSDFILLDEPFSYVSPVLVESLMSDIKKASKSKGILLTDHNFESILEISDRLYLMKEKSLFLVNSRQDLKDFGYLS